MKTKATIILVICLFIAPGIAISQSSGKTKTKEKAEKELEFYKYFKDGSRYPNMDSIAPSLRRLASTALSNVNWGRSSDEYFQLLDNSRNSSFSFRKEFREKKTINRSYDMEFTKDNKSMSIRISANASEGSIKITIVKPSGKNFKVLEVEDMESLSWNHTLNAYTEGNKKEYEGTWLVKVAVQNAVGYYSIKLNMK